MNREQARKLEQKYFLIWSVVLLGVNTATFLLALTNSYYSLAGGVAGFVCAVTLLTFNLWDIWRSRK